MEWLEEHIRHFVLPGIRAIVAAKGKDVLSTDIQPWKANLRPTKGCLFSEAGLVLSALSSMGQSFQNAENHEGDGAFNRSKIQVVNLERLRNILMKCDPNLWSSSHSRYDIKQEGVEWYDIIHTITKNSWKSIRSQCQKQKKSLVLAGRDVWVWEIFARKDNFPSTYDSRISRLLIPHKKVLQKIVEGWRVNNALVFDTGFAGSIWRALCEASGCPLHSHSSYSSLMSALGSPVERNSSRNHRLGNLMLSTELQDDKGQSYQLFSKHQGSRAKALTIEYLPKYFKTGTVKEDKPVQFLAPLEEFIQTAAMTIWFWHYKSPKFIESPKKLERQKRLKALESN
jgi:hypothetical protein